MASALALVCYSFYPGYQARLIGLVNEMARAGDTVVFVRGPAVPSASSPHAGLAWHELPFDGEGWEFGAFQVGLDRLQALGWAGPVLLLNDTAGIHYPLPRRERDALASVARDLQHLDSKVLAGHVQAAPPGFVYRGVALPAWVRSSAFVLSAAALRALRGRVFDADEFAAPRVSDQGLALPPHLSPALAQYLRDWLTNGGKRGWRHHARRREVSADLLRNKAGAILLEKRLSALVLAHGGELRHCGPRTDGWRYRLGLRGFFWRRRVAASLASLSRAG